jgi:hypothetical protein
VEPLATRCLDEAFQAASLKFVTQLSRRLNDRLPGRVLARIEIEYQPVGLRVQEDFKDLGGDTLNKLDVYGPPSTRRRASFA